MSHDEKQSKIAYEKWQVATDAGDDKKAAVHMQDYLNYQEMIKMGVK